MVEGVRICPNSRPSWDKIVDSVRDRPEECGSVAARKVAQRFVQQGLLAADDDRDGVHHALDDLNQRLRYAIGEYDGPPPSVPLSP
jgi:hypothetical protein